MKWLITNDIQNIRKYIEKASKGKSYLFFPSEEEIVEKLREGKSFNVVASYPPPERFKGLFITYSIDKDIFTSQEKKFLEKKPQLESKLLQEKFGIKIFKSQFTLKDVEGMDRLKEFADSLKKIQYGSLFFPKSIFLVGVAGTGKSFSMKAIAGELDYFITEISLIELMEKGEPATRLEQILNFLESKGIYTIVWIDEVEKAFINEKSTELMNKLLPVLQEWNETSYFVKGFWWFTANNLTILKNTFPEFLRSERHDYLWFVDYPKDTDAEKIANLYINKFFLAPYEKIRVDKENYERVREAVLDEETKTKAIKNFVEFTRNKTALYQTEGIIDQDRIVYTPAEIKTFIKLWAKRSFLEGKFSYSGKLFQEIANFINPVIDIARDTIKDLRSQRSIFKPLN